MHLLHITVMWADLFLVSGLFKSNISQISSCFVSCFKQGGVPTPFDRNYGTKLGVRAVQWLTEKMANTFRQGEGSLTSSHFSHVLESQCFRHFCVCVCQVVCLLTLQTRPAWSDSTGKIWPLVLWLNWRIRRTSSEFSAVKFDWCNV